MKFENMIGKKFNKLTVLSFVKSNKQGRFWLCQCDCGNQTIVRTHNLIHNVTKSCGCLQKEKNIKRLTKHNMCRTRLYVAWENMKARCYYKKSKRYNLYGGRGIKVCDEWKNDFMNFYNWAMKNGYRDDLTIDRIDVNGNYEPSNCRWISNLSQQSNRTNNKLITYNEETKALCEWAREYNLNWKTLQKRLNMGWDINKALNIPVKRN